MFPDEWMEYYASERRIHGETLRANRLAWRRLHPSEPRDVSRRGRKPRARFERNTRDVKRDAIVVVWAGMVYDVAA